MRYITLLVHHSFIIYQCCCCCWEKKKTKRNDENKKWRKIIHTRCVVYVISSVLFEKNSQLSIFSVFFFNIQYYWSWMLPHMLQALNFEKLKLTLEKNWVQIDFTLNIMKWREQNYDESNKKKASKRWRKN